MPNIPRIVSAPVEYIPVLSARFARRLAVCAFVTVLDVAVITTFGRDFAVAADRNGVIVEAIDVEKSFGDMKVLKGVSLTVRRQEVVVIVGASGSGKTTFIRCINHLEKIDSGRLWVDGHLVGYRQRGEKLHEMRESEVASRSLGIDTVRLKAVAFFVSSVIVGLAGGLYGHSIGYVSPDIGTIFASVNFVLMLVLGGIGTAWGPLIGAVILTLLPQWLFDFERYHLLVLGIILLVSIMLMPKGIASLARRRRTPFNLHMTEPRP